MVIHYRDVLSRARSACVCVGVCWCAGMNVGGGVVCVWGGGAGVCVTGGGGGGACVWGCVRAVTLFIFF